MSEAKVKGVPPNPGAETEESTAQGCTPTKKEIFLKAYREIGTIRGSYKAADVCRRTIYNWLADDEAFRTAFADAKEDFADSLEEKLYKRLEEAGQNRANIELLAALKAHRREKWGDNITITPKDAVITFRVVRVNDIADYVSPEELDTLKQLNVGSEEYTPAVSEAERITEES